jgi:uncharacterized protein GlcG (DUF336 family)
VRVAVLKVLGWAIAGLIGIVAQAQESATLGTGSVSQEAQTLPPGNLAGDAGAVQLRPGEVFRPNRAAGPPPWDRGPDGGVLRLSVALEGAHAAIAACESQAHVAIAVGVLDSAGQPRATLAADGVRGWHIYSATRKALTAVALKVPSSRAVAGMAANPVLAAQLRPNMTTLPGAVPLWAGGELVGAIGVSGARSGEQDEKCAAAGARRIGYRLKTANTP